MNKVHKMKQTGIKIVKGLQRIDRMDARHSTRLHLSVLHNQNMDMLNPKRRSNSVMNYLNKAVRNVTGSRFNDPFVDRKAKGFRNKVKAQRDFVLNHRRNMKYYKGVRNARYKSRAINNTTYIRICFYCYKVQKEP